MNIVRIFSVSLPRAGHHVAEMVLRGLMGEAFAYCEFYTIAGCCKEFPCNRISQHATRGAAVFMQKSHDHNLSDPFPANIDGILVQVREPIARALSNYELDLATVGAPHSESYLRFWLGKEAAYANGFFRKWRADADRRVLIARYEDLLDDPVLYFQRIFEKFRIPKIYFDAGAVQRMLETSSAGTFSFQKRDALRSPHYIKEPFSAYASLVSAAAPAGYAQSPSASPKRRDLALETCFRAFTALLVNDLAGALASLDQYLAMPNPHYAARQQRALVLTRLGRSAEAETALRRVLSEAPDFASASIDLAGLQDERGDVAGAQDTLAAALRAAKAPEKVHERIIQSFAWAERRSILVPANVKPPPAPPPPEIAIDPRLSRQDVIEAFRWILGRDPESEDVIENHRLTKADALRAVLLKSSEFAEKFKAARGG